MPTAVTHVLLTIIAVDILRDYVFKHKHLLNMKVLLFAGVMGLAPDIDIPLYWLLKNILGLDIGWFHRTFTHSVFIPLIFLALALIYSKRHKVMVLFAVASFAWTFHIGLDMVFAGYAMPFWPLSTTAVGLDILGRLGWPDLMEGLDALLLLGWLLHEEIRHKISDFI
ncbi:MAG: metal-dependent hydrolase [Nanoarchaeota archaeon]